MTAAPGMSGPLHDRRAHELQEEAQLAPVASRAVRSRGRRLPEPEDPLRTAFQRDRDRIIHSTAFRRLQHKTQVFSAVEGDYYRSRLTHTLEVSQMARSVARALRLNVDLTEAVALGHDLGHPPFGHAGEEALAALMANHGGFRHNAQGLRIVDSLEHRYPHRLGLNLTWEVRRSLLKGKVPDGFPLAADLDPDTEPPLEASVVDLCDRAAYLAHDLDDAFFAELVDTKACGDLQLWRQAAQRVEAQHGDVSGRTRVLLVINQIVGLLVQDLIHHSHARLRAGAPRLSHSPQSMHGLSELLGFLRTRFYKSPRILERMHAGKRLIAKVFGRLLADPSGLPPSFRERIDDDGLQRVVCDYLAGMTDRFLDRLGGDAE